MPKTTTFEHGGRIYEVRAIPTLNGWMVRIFIDGIPANGFTYSVNSEIYQDAALNRVPEDLVAGLMETAERDFRRGLLQELMTLKRATDDDIEAESINSNHESAPVSKSLALSREIQTRTETPAGVIAKPTRYAFRGGRLGTLDGCRVEDEFNAYSGNRWRCRSRAGRLRWASRQEVAARLGDHSSGKM